MKDCPNCRNQIADDSVFCPICGTAVGIVPQFSPQNNLKRPQETITEPDTMPMDAPTAPYIDPYDHTKEFDHADISEHKHAAMLAYLLGPVGILIALLAAADSKYGKFHIKQAMKLTVAEILGCLMLAAASCILWSIRLRILMLFAVAVAFAAFVGLHLLCFYQVCKGNAVEVYFVRRLRFLE